MNTDQHSTAPEDTPDTAASAVTNDAFDRRNEAHRNFFSRLYTGTGAFEVVGNRVKWYRVTGAIVAVALLSILIRGFSFGIDFEGGSRIQLPAGGNASEHAVSSVYSKTLGHDPVSVQTVGAGASKAIQIRSEALSSAQSNKLQNALFDSFQPKDSTGKASADAISIADVSSTWGGQITQKAVLALGVFLLAVAAYIAFRFERYMAISALVTLGFDLSVTAGVYALVGLEVTPATVIGMLTILGYSLYDTVVVFDKVDENTRGILHLNKRTYAEQANLALNQTLMRSINTTIIGIIPVLSMMIIAVWLLGVGTLKDLALVMLVGMAVGAYSSIFFATPLLVTMKERWGPTAAHTKKVLARRAVERRRASPPVSHPAGPKRGLSLLGRERDPPASAPRTGSDGSTSLGKRRPAKYLMGDNTMAKRSFLTVLAAGCVASTIAGCTADSVPSIGYAVDGPITTYNASSLDGYGSAAAQAFPRTLIGFSYVGPNGLPIEDTDLGTANVVPGDALTVQYRINPRAVFSDGAPDLL